MTAKHRETAAAPPLLPNEQRGPLLRRLAALEWLQTALGIALLGAIGLRAFFTAEEDAIGSALVIAGMSGMLLFTLVLRVQLGRESLRRDVRVLELRRDLELSRAPERTRTAVGLRRMYRSRFLRPLRAAVTRMRRAEARRRRRLGSRLPPKARHAHVREHGLGRR